MSLPSVRRRTRLLALLIAPVLLLAGGLTAVQAQAAPAAANSSVFGPNVYVFTADMSQSSIQSTLDAIAARQVPNQFGAQRYSLFFAPGTYGTKAQPLNFQVGYYTQVAGLGRNPGDVTINGSIDVYNQCDSTGCTALDNFWRSLSNLTIDLAGKSDCQASADFWAVSQAAPMRRVNFAGGNVSLQDYCSAGPQYASGGYIADSSFSGGTVINGSQQQFVVRNSNLDGWSNGVWNQVFAGTLGAPAQSFGQPSAQPYTTLDTNPTTQEEPYLYLDRGAYRVFVPSLQHNTRGTSWANGATPGRSLPMSSFFVANPRTPVGLINLALAFGKNLILTPGVYNLTQTINVLRPDTVVLGMGFATLVPQHGIVAMRVADVPGVKLSGMIFDAGPVSSPALLQVGQCKACGWSSAADPTLVQDVFFRIGGATPGKADTALVVNSSHVLLDDIWSWRADHGAGVGWTANTARTGLLVNGNDVSAYGLFVEHYQGFQVVWNGERGRDVFFQNEMPYDVPNQSAWMSSPTTKGYAAFLVAPKVRTFSGYGMGSYSFFNQGVDIHASQGFQAPANANISLNDLLTVFLNGSGGIDSVVDGVGAPVNSSNAGTPSDVIRYP